MNNSRSNFPISSQTFQPMLRESIDRFLLEYRQGSRDFSNISLIFSRILQISPDPPLEIVWFYSALTYQTTKFGVQNPSEQVSRVKDLFQLLVSFSSSNGVKKIAVLAPVLYELYGLVIDRKSSRKEVESLLEVIISYISICCSMELEEEDELEDLNLFEDLIKVWTVDKCGKDVRVFFPVISEEVCEGVKGGRGASYLAGIVMFEVFLLRLCLKFDTRILRAELEKDMHSWVIHTISGFQNFYFLEILLRMLLESVLPVSSLLKFEDEVLLREVLYDSVIMVDYPFISSQNGRKACGKHIKSISIMLLLVAESAIRFVRENGDNTKVNSYLNSLSKSCLASQLLKWVTCQTGSRVIASRPTVASPAALIKWLLTVEDLGVKVFDSNILKLHAKAVVCKSRVEYELPIFKLGCENEEDGIFRSAYCNGTMEDKFNHDLEMVDSSDAMLMTSTSPLDGTVTDASRKRKDGSKEESETPVKFVKLHLQENITRCRFFQPGTEESRGGMDKLVVNGDAFEMEY